MAKLPDPPVRPTDIERFWSKVDRACADECWLWTGTKNPRGYGQLWMGKLYPVYGAHRLSLLIAGKPSNGLIALHACDNPACVNPDHLSWDTYQRNAAERYERKRCQERTGESHPMARLTAVDVRAIRASGEGRATLATQFGTSPDNITQIRAGRRWKHVGEAA